MKLDRSTKFQIRKEFVQQLHPPLAHTAHFWGKTREMPLRLAKARQRRQWKRCLNPCIQMMMRWCGKGLQGPSKSYLPSTWPSEKYSFPCCVLLGGRVYPVSSLLFMETGVCCQERDAPGPELGARTPQGCCTCGMNAAPQGRTPRGSEASRVLCRLGRRFPPPGGTSFWTIQMLRDFKN